MDKVIKTRISKDSEPVETKLHINFDGVTEEQLHELAARSIIIATQAIYRTAGNVPATDAVDVMELLKRERKGAVATPENVANKLKKMTPEERALVLKMAGL